MLKTVICLALPVMAFAASNGDNTPDQKVVAKIQKALAKDDSLKAYASAVSVSLERGVVTLKGTVQSDEQSQDIEAKAESEVIQRTPIDRIHEVVVSNQLTVSP